MNNYYWKLMIPLLCERDLPDAESIGDVDHPRWWQMSPRILMLQPYLEQFNHTNRDFRVNYDNSVPILKRVDRNHGKCLTTQATTLRRVHYFNDPSSISVLFLTGYMGY